VQILTRPMEAAIVVALLALASIAAPPQLSARAQSGQAGVQLTDLGVQKPTGGNWSFKGDFAITAGAFESITVTTADRCFAGPLDPRIGAEDYARLFFFQLAGPAGPDGVNGFTYSAYRDNGFTAPGGVDVTGSATVSTNRDASKPATHVEVTLSGSGLDSYSGSSLRVCLLGSN
jgi:hypothetical protein